MNQIGSNMCHWIQNCTKINIFYCFILQFMSNTKNNTMLQTKFRCLHSRIPPKNSMEILKYKMDDGNYISNYDNDWGKSSSLHYYFVWYAWFKIILSKFSSLLYHVLFHPSTKNLFNSYKRSLVTIPIN